MTTTCPRAGGRPSSVATRGAALGVGLALGDDDDPDGVGAASCLPPPEHAADNTRAAMATTAADVVFRVTSTPMLRLGQQLVHRPAAEPERIDLGISEVREQIEESRQLRGHGVDVLPVDLDPRAIAQVSDAQV